MLIGLIPIMFGAVIVEIVQSIRDMLREIEKRTKVFKREVRGGRVGGRIRGNFNDVCDNRFGGVCSGGIYLYYIESIWRRNGSGKRLFKRV